MFLNLAHAKLDVLHWSKNLTLECYRITKGFPSDEKYARVQQIMRAVLSVHLNIAEGCSRKSKAERRRYFEIARGSVIEVDTSFDIATNLRYVELSAIEHLGELVIKCFKQLTGLTKDE